MLDDQVKDVQNEMTEAVNNYPGYNDDLSLEALILLITAERLKHLQDNTHKELSELKKRQEQVQELHKTLKAINNATDEKGELKSTEELKKLFEKAKELGADVDLTKESYTKEERERLVENIRMTVDDLNVQNDMQLQTVSRLTNERYESYQMARSIMRPLHEAKTRLAQAIAGK